MKNSPLKGVIPGSGGIGKEVHRGISRGIKCLGMESTMPRPSPHPAWLSDRVLGNSTLQGVKAFSMRRSGMSQRMATTTYSMKASPALTVVRTTARA